MIMTGYFESISESIKYLIAVGSIIGLLGFILCLIVAVAGGNYNRWKFLGYAILFGIVCLSCGGPTIGIKYFRIH